MSDLPSYSDLIFEVLTPLGFRVRTTRSHWGKIVTHKHPVMAGHEDLVEEVILMKDKNGQVIGFEKLNLALTRLEPLRLSFEALAA
jgi:hypothetical protein